MTPKTSTKPLGGKNEEKEEEKDGRVLFLLEWVDGWGGVLFCWNR